MLLARTKQITESCIGVEQRSRYIRNPSSGIRIGSSRGLIVRALGLYIAVSGFESCQGYCGVRKSIQPLIAPVPHRNTIACSSSPSPPIAEKTKVSH